MSTHTTQSLTLFKSIGLAAVATVALLMVPLVAMQFSQDVQWSVFDFMVAGVLLFASGLTLILLVWHDRKNKYRVAIGAAILLTLALIWVELAVGLFTDLGS